MRLRFDVESSKWLHARLNGFVKLANAREEAQELARTAAKMRYKFSGAPSLTYLGVKERNLVRSLAEHARDISPSADERVIGRRIMEVLNATENNSPNTCEPKATD